MSIPATIRVSFRVRPELWCEFRLACQRRQVDLEDVFHALLRDQLDRWDDDAPSRLRTAGDGHRAFPRTLAECLQLYNVRQQRKAQGEEQHP